MKEICVLFVPHKVRSFNIYNHLDQSHGICWGRLVMVLFEFTECVCDKYLDVYCCCAWCRILNVAFIWYIWRWTIGHGRLLYLWLTTWVGGRRETSTWYIVWFDWNESNWWNQKNNIFEDLILLHSFFIGIKIKYVHCKKINEFSYKIFLAS